MSGLHTPRRAPAGACSTWCLAAAALGVWRAPSSRRATPLAGEVDATAPLRLPDGTWLDTSPLGPGDADALQDFVSGLSARSRYLRFHVGIPRLPQALLARLVEADPDRQLALAVRAGPTGPLVAEARFVRDGERDGLTLPASAEFALVVADAWQGRGLGRAVLRRLCRLARAQGLQSLHGRVLTENAGVRALVRRLGGELQSLHDEPGLMRARLDVSRALA